MVTVVAATVAPVLTTLSRRLLSYLVRRPQLLQTVDGETRRMFAEHAESDVFAEIVNYIDTNPETDRSELLGRWAGQPIAADLARLADGSSILEDEAMARELAEGLASYLAVKARDRRRKLLSELKEAPTADKLDKLRALHSLQTQHTPPKDRSNSD